jgi:hypothetical protein
MRSRYIGDHRKKYAKRRAIRAKGHNCLVDIVGPYFPRRDDPDTRDFYCAAMLSLLKPWRDVTQLKDATQTWEDAFASFMTQASAWHHDVVANIQYRYDSRSAATSRNDTEPTDAEDHYGDDDDNQSTDSNNSETEMVSAVT